MPSFLQFSSKVKSSPGGVTPPSSFPARLLSPMKSHPVSILLGTQCGDSEVPWKQRHEDPSNRSITSIWALRLRGKVEPWSVLTSTFRYQPQQGQYQCLSGEKAQSVRQWTQKPPNWSSCFQTCPLHSPSPSFFYTKHPGSPPWKCNLMSTDLRIRSLSE